MALSRSPVVSWHTASPFGRLQSYQTLFITYGVVSIAWGIFVFVWMFDSPMRANCFSEADKNLIIKRVRMNQTSIQSKKLRSEQVKEALTDPQTWCYCLIAICTTLSTSELGASAGITIKGLSVTCSLQEMLLTQSL